MDFSTLKSVLNNSPIKDRDIALYQVINGLISGLQTVSNESMPLIFKKGIWTPSDASGAALAITYDSNEYTQIDDLIFACAHVTYPATADGSAASIGGFPFRVANLVRSIYPVILSFNNSGLVFLGRARKNTYNFIMTSNAGVAITNANLSTFELQFLAIYRTDEV